jgi:hypothetical protein
VAGVCFSGKAHGDLRDDIEVEVILAGNAGVAGEEGVVGESMSNSCETVFMKCRYSTMFYGFGF